jgi:hypothetical protein
VAESGSDKRRITLELSADLLAWLDELKPSMGFRSRGPLVEQLLRELQPQEVDDPDGSDPNAASDHASASSSEPSERQALLDDVTALVLVHGDLVSLRDSDRFPSETTGTARERAPGGGIQLPGFVRQQAREVKRSLRESPLPMPEASSLSLVSVAELQDALARCQLHWLEVYGQPPTDAVVDAAMSWLARDIWPQSDHSDGRPFSWGLAQQVISSMTSGWIAADPSFERVITAAGILEDPFGGNTLAVRVPTLVTRFVQRQRSRHKRTTSFEAIDQAITVHSALRLLHLPTIADRPYTLKEIREAYREQAQLHHPDAGGSADAMRRLNEAYQFLKDRYRRTA